MWGDAPLEYGFLDVWRAQTVIERKLVSTPDGAYCPVRATLALVGQKWVPHIVYHLMPCKRRFNELARAVGGCNSRTLRDRLADLEGVGVVSRNIVETMPPRVEYELTARGQELAQALSPLAGWGTRHMVDQFDEIEEVNGPTAAAAG
ncbi:MAG TPA: helix-turn-helix domain-containing protein [Dehalococcoidia bacterium]|nr:helix-turn-helix domain-containing protein [Dehalococcoidia bacterium]